MPSRVFIANGEVQVEVEGEEEFIEKKLAKLLPFVIGDESAAPAPGRKKGEERKDDKEGAGPAPHTLKEYIKMKAPGNVYEAIALVLDFGRKYQDKTELSGEEIRRRLIQGGYRPAQSGMTQALADARRKYGYVEVGSKRSLWKLSAEGETVVELDLPRSKKSE